MTPSREKFKETLLRKRQLQIDIEKLQILVEKYPNNYRYKAQLEEKIDEFNII